MIVPTLKPAAPTWSLSVAARPGMVVPLRTATVTLAGLTAPPLGFCLPVPFVALPSDWAVCGRAAAAVVARQLGHAVGRRAAEHEHAHQDDGDVAGADAAVPGLCAPARDDDRLLRSGARGAGPQRGALWRGAATHRGSDWTRTGADRGRAARSRRRRGGRRPEWPGAERSVRRAGLGSAGRGSRLSWAGRSGCGRGGARLSAGGLRRGGTPRRRRPPPSRHRPAWRPGHPASRLGRAARARPDRAWRPRRPASPLAARAGRLPPERLVCRQRPRRRLPLPPAPPSQRPWPAPALRAAWPVERWPGPHPWPRRRPGVARERREARWRRAAASAAAPRRGPARVAPRLPSARARARPIRASALRHAPARNRGPRAPPGPAPRPSPRQRRSPGLSPARLEL